MATSIAATDRVPIIDIIRSCSCCLFQDLAKTRATAVRPVLLQAVELLDRVAALGNDHPGLFRGRENVDVGRDAVSMLQGPDPDETDLVTESSVIAPQRDVAIRAA